MLWLGLQQCAMIGESMAPFRKGLSLVGKPGKVTEDFSCV